MGKVLVTGAAGFVGRHVVRRLLERGDEVHAVDSVVPRTGGIHPDRGWPLFEPRDHAGFVFHERDCRDWFAEQAPDDFDYAFHLAAIVGGREMIEHDPIAVAEDLSIDAAYWRWAVRANPQRTLTFSSSAAYPVAYQRPEGYRLLEEDMIRFDASQPLGVPDLTYGWSKLTAEFLGRIAHERHGLRSIAYRPFSGFGEDQDPSYPVPAICRRALDAKGSEDPRFRVWGSGEQMRDLVYIEDCVDCMMETRDLIDDGGALNISTGLFTSMKQIAQEALERTGQTAEVVGDSDRPEGVFARAGDTAKQEALGFRARTPWREGIGRVLARVAERR